VGNIRSFHDLEVYEAATGGATEVFQGTTEFPKAETYSMVDQIRRSSRSVCANLREA
jgi:four helix bundle protein